MNGRKKRSQSRGRSFWVPPQLAVRAAYFKARYEQRLGETAGALMQPSLREDTLG